MSSRSRRLDIGSLVNDAASNTSSNRKSPPRNLPPPGMRITALMHRLRGLPLKRNWQCRANNAQLDLNDPHTVESIMMYERGNAQDEATVCGRCRQGEGISTECVTIPDIPWACSNCLYNGSGELCEAAREAARSEGPEDEEFWENVNKIADKSFVLALVAQIKQRAGYGEDESPITRAREIEEAAKAVARLTREWRLKEQQKVRTE